MENFELFLSCQTQVLALFMVKKYVDNLYGSDNFKFYCQIHSRTWFGVVKVLHTRNNRKSNKNWGFLICQMEENYDESEHKNQILEIKRFAVFKNHKICYPLAEYKTVE